MSEKTSHHETLLPEAIRRRLESLALNARTIRSGSMKGERRSVKHGTSIEFADYRQYTAGDDLRKLDWNVYARLEKPVIKLLEDEEDLATHIILDMSASMNWPQANPDNKLLFAKRLAAALAYMALKTGDRLMLSAVNDSEILHFGPARGRSQIVPMLQYLHNIEARGVTDLNQKLRDYAIREKRAGLVILISDMFSPTGYIEGLNMLLGKGHEVAFIHLLAPDEVNPPLAGDLSLVDVETGQTQEVTIDSDMRSIYEQRLNRWLDSIRDEAARKGVHYLMVQTDSPYEKVILFELRKLGLVK